MVKDWDKDYTSADPCCACGESPGTVRTIFCLDKKAPIPGTGWGCVICGLPADGAIAAICDDCFDKKAEIKTVCHGYAVKGKRIPIEEVTEEFSYDMNKHR